MRRWLLHPLGWLLGAALLVTLLLAAAIRLDQDILRWRAERLQADIKSLELRKSTYADARRLENRWLAYTREGACRPQWCDLQIYIQNTSSRHSMFLVNHPAALAIYRGLGGRLASVYSTIAIRENLLWEKGIGLMVGATATWPDGSRTDYALMGRVETDSLPWLSARHPEYHIGGPSGCMGCRAGWVKFTAFADPKDVSRLTDLNFSCITRWKQCTEQADVLPTAWNEMQAEIAKDDPDGRDSCSPAAVRVLSREAHRVLLAKVIRLQNSIDGPVATVPRISDGVSQYPDEWQERAITMRPADKILSGDRLLILENSTCPAVAATPENLAAARRGVSEGWLSPPRSQSLPFGNLDAPKIDVH